MKKLLSICFFLVMSVSVAFGAVNINTATEKELQSLMGIGPKKAQAIVAYRTKNGSFKTIEDIKNVNGISDKTFSQLQKDISISGATEVKEKKAPKKMTKQKQTKEQPKKQ